jgi:hypothetical protein
MAAKSTSRINERRTLLVVWLSFFIVNGAIITLIYLRGWIEHDNFLSAIKQWNTSYAPYIGAMTLYYWASGKKKDALKNENTGVAFYFALICSVLWNSIVFACLWPPLMGTGAIETSIDNIQQITSLLSWLVGGAIGYYFAKPISK